MPDTLIWPYLFNMLQKAMRQEIKNLGWQNRTDLNLEEIAKIINPKIHGWMNYYGKYNKTEFKKVMRYLNKRLVTWVMRKYKRLAGKKTRSVEFLYRIRETNPILFAHWNGGMKSVFI